MKDKGEGELDKKIQRGSDRNYKKKKRKREINKERRRKWESDHRSHSRTNTGKDFWAERFPSTNIYSRFINHKESFPFWSEYNTSEFIASDSVHGLTLKTAREATNIALAGSAISAISTAGFAWKY